MKFINVLQWLGFYSHKFSLLILYLFIPETALLSVNYHLQILTNVVKVHTCATSSKTASTRSVLTSVGARMDSSWISLQQLVSVRRIYKISSLHIVIELCSNFGIINFTSQGISSSGNNSLNVDLMIDKQKTQSSIPGLHL